jgi:hypothetical protein
MHAGGQRQNFFDRLQAVSGGYLAFFLLNYVGAVLFARPVLDLDTNFFLPQREYTPLHFNTFLFRTISLLLLYFLLTWLVLLLADERTAAFNRKKPRGI